MIGKVGQNELVILGGDHNRHVGNDVNGYDGIHGGFGYGARNLQGERILEMGPVLDMIICNMFFKNHNT